MIINFKSYPPSSALLLAASISTLATGVALATLGILQLQAPFLSCSGVGWAFLGTGGACILGSAALFRNFKTKDPHRYSTLNTKVIEKLAPKEMWLEILINLDLKSLGACQRSCKYFCQLIQKDLSWEKIAKNLGVELSVTKERARLLLKGISIVKKPITMDMACFCYDDKDSTRTFLASGKEIHVSKKHKEEVIKCSNLVTSLCFGKEMLFVGFLNGKIEFRKNENKVWATLLGTGSSAKVRNLYFEKQTLFARFDDSAIKTWTVNA